MGAVLIGIDNPFRHDDGVGVVAADAARPRLPPGVRVAHLDGEPSRIVDAWAGADLAVVVDALRSGAPPGTVRRMEVGVDDLPCASAGASSHSLGVAAAVGLGRALGRLPRRVVLIGVEGADFSEGLGLTPSVAAGVRSAAELVVEEIREWSDEGGAASAV